MPRVFHDNYIHTIFVGGTVGVCHVFAMLVTEYSCHGNNPKLQQQKEVGEAYSLTAIIPNFAVLLLA